MPIVLPAKGLLDFYQADSLEVINVDYNRIEKDKIRVSRGLSPDDGFSIPKEDIHTTTYYNRDLLSYFFCAIKEKLPIIQFRSFYNVLEFLFEEAPKQMHFNVKTERQQIRCVISWITTKWEVSSFLNSLDSDIVKNLVKPYEIEPGIEIEGLTLSSGHILESIADFIYSYRCACVHSKKTIKGAQSVRLIPYTKDEDRVAYLVPLMQWLSIKCMEKDAKMTNYRLVD